MSHVRYYLDPTRSVEVEDLIALLEKNHVLFDLPKTDPNRIRAEGMVLDRHYKYQFLSRFQRSELRFQPGHESGRLQVVVQGLDLDFSEDLLVADERLVVDGALCYDSVEVVTNFQLPPGYLRDLGSYSDADAKDSTYAELTWENKEGGRYKVTVQSRSLGDAWRLIRHIYHGEIAPLRTVNKAGP